MTVLADCRWINEQSNRLLADLYRMGQKYTVHNGVRQVVRLSVLNGHCRIGRAFAAELYRMSQTGPIRKVRCRSTAGHCLSVLVGSGGD